MKVTLLPHQWETLTSKAKFKAMISGIGAGKTWTGVHWILNQGIKYPKALGFIGANTFAQLRNSTLSALFNEFSRLEIPFSYNQSSGYLEFLGARCLCKSMENYDGLRGVELGYIWLDEGAFMREEAYNVIVGRLRDKKGPLELLITSTPNGFNFIFDYFQGEKKTKDHLLIKAKSSDNKHLPDGYIDSLKTQYDEKLLAQELNGEFVNVTQGQVYYAFDPLINVEEVKQINGTTFLNLDFNVTPLSGCLMQIINKEFHVFDEIFLLNSDTYKLVDHIKKKGFRGVEIIPDSTARNRKTSGMSDVQILEEAGHRVAQVRNPRVVDRVNNTNRLLSQGRVKIHPRCKKLINDLEKVTWKDGNLDQKTDHLLTHISDALGYGLWHHEPIIGNRESRSIIL